MLTTATLFVLLQHRTEAEARADAAEARSNLSERALYAKQQVSLALPLPRTCLHGACRIIGVDRS
jgi:hypothetical protein